MESYSSWVTSKYFVFVLVYIGCYDTINIWDIPCKFKHQLVNNPCCTILGHCCLAFGIGLKLEGDVRSKEGNHILKKKGENRLQERLQPASDGYALPWKGLRTNKVGSAYISQPGNLAYETNKQKRPGETADVVLLKYTWKMVFVLPSIVRAASRRLCEPKDSVYKLRLFLKNSQQSWISCKKHWTLYRAL